MVLEPVLTLPGGLDECLRRMSRRPGGVTQGLGGVTPCPGGVSQMILWTDAMIERVGVIWREM